MMMDGLREDEYKYAEQCGCGSYDIAAWSGSEGHMCGECWKEYQHKKKMDKEVERAGKEGE